MQPRGNDVPHSAQSAHLIRWLGDQNGIDGMEESCLVISHTRTLRMIRSQSCSGDILTGDEVRTSAVPRRLRDLSGLLSGPDMFAHVAHVAILDTPLLALLVDRSNRRPSASHEGERHSIQPAVSTCNTPLHCRHSPPACHIVMLP